MSIMFDMNQLIVVFLTFYQVTKTTKTKAADFDGRSGRSGRREESSSGALTEESSKGGRQDRRHGLCSLERI